MRRCDEVIGKMGEVYRTMSEVRWMTEGDVQSGRSSKVKKAYT